MARHFKPGSVFDDDDELVGGHADADAPAVPAASGNAPGTLDGVPGQPDRVPGQADGLSGVSGGVSNESDNVSDGANSLSVNPDILSDASSDASVSSDDLSDAAAGEGHNSSDSPSDESASPGDSGVWPSLEDAPRKRHSKEWHAKRRRRRIIARTLIVVAAILVIGGAGAAFAINRSIEEGRKSFQESMQKTVEEKGGTVEFEGKTYALNEHMATIAFIGFDNRTTNAASGDSVPGQSDAVMVIALDTETGKATGIVIPRDSMVDVDTYVDGNFAGTQTLQLCLQYSYGSTPEQSSELVAQCASRILYDMPIDYYFTLNIEGVAPINDSVGGITLTPVQSVPGTSVVEGQQITLLGTNAERYVQWRDTTQPNSSLDRQARQVSYLRAFTSQILDKAKADPSVLMNLYQTASDYTWTNLGVDQFSYLASTMLQHGVSSFELRTLGGEMGHGERYAEFTLDRNDVYRTVVETFYHEVS